MDRFVKAVDNVSATVLVPSKLRDMDISGRRNKRIPPALANTDLYSFYLMLQEVRKELLWGPGTAAASAATVTSISSLSAMTAGRLTLTRSDSLQSKNHSRQPSDDSLRSLGSTASTSDQDTDSEVDSLMTSVDRESVDEHTSHLATAFRHHLQGLHTILHQLADCADYLACRYQEEIEGSSLWLTGRGRRNQPQQRMDQESASQYLRGQAGRFSQLHTLKEVFDNHDESVDHDLTTTNVEESSSSSSTWTRSYCTVLSKEICNMMIDLRESATAMISSHNPLQTHESIFPYEILFYEQ